jgi:hypothetical protein
VNYLIVSVIIFVINLFSQYIGEKFNSISIAVNIATLFTSIAVCIYVIYCLTGELYA